MRRSPAELRSRPPSELSIACFATQGSDSGDEQRITALLAPLNPTLLEFDRARKGRSALSIFRSLVRERPDLVVMEGTGLAGGVAVLLAAELGGVRFVFSSGDAVAPYLSLRSRWLSLPGALYERALCAKCAGFIGWSPYLVGRALTLGAPRAMTAANWAGGEFPASADREVARRRFGIPPDAVVFGLVGSLAWNERVGYCYGLELVRAAIAADRPDLRVLVVGDGDGRERLEQLAGDRLGETVILPGPVPREQVPEALAAMDIASLPQSLDGVGSFRYTTKISEYVAAGLPVVTSQIPLAYDLDDGWLWRLPGDAPWNPRYIRALAELMASVTRDEIIERRQQVSALPIFDRARQTRQVREFILELCAPPRP